eukprot:5424456-Prymnesium_polylepis.1
MVWDGPHARLRRRLVPRHSEAAPDFALAADRSLNTAARLGLQRPPERLNRRTTEVVRRKLPGAGGMAHSSSRCTCGSGYSSRSGASGWQQSARRAPPYELAPFAAEEEWLAAEQRDFMQVLTDKMRSAQEYVAYHGPDARRAAVKSLDSAWRNHTGRECAVLSLPRLQQMVAKVAIEDITGPPFDPDELEPPLHYVATPADRVLGRGTEYAPMG